MLLRQISEKLLSTPAATKFNIRNTPCFYILCANPSLAVFYADFFRHHDANPSILKDLELRSGIFYPDRSNFSITPFRDDKSPAPVSKPLVSGQLRHDDT